MQRVLVHSLDVVTHAGVRFPFPGPFDFIVEDERSAARMGVEHEGLKMGHILRSEMLVARLRTQERAGSDGVFGDDQGCVVVGVSLQIHRFVVDGKEDHEMH